MKIQQIYTNCLAQGAYYIESKGEAAIIDPLREIQPYLDLAESRNATIKFIFETHFHADFVSGHVDLAKQTGATIVFGPTSMTTGYDVLVALDLQTFQLGAASIQLLHTPGHTAESSCYLLTNEEGKATALFTGDTLFIGDVGRPDLAQKVIAELTEVKLASMLYDSLHTKILPLPDNLIVYPGHGAGSACGKNMSKETTDTLGNQKKTNYALNPALSRESFIEQVLDGLTPPPGYFPYNVLLNIGGYEAIDTVIERGTTSLSLDQFQLIRNDSAAMILDTRNAEEFAQGFIPGSYNIGLDGAFANWVGVIFQDVKQPLVIIAEEGKAEEVATRLSRIGFDANFGYLEGGVQTWKNSGKVLDQIERLDPSELPSDAANRLLDIRKQSEFESEHIVGAHNIPLDYWRDKLSEVPKGETYYVHCAGGYRSMIFTSIFRSFGYANLKEVRGGFNALKKAENFEMTDFVCPSTQL